MAAPTEPLPPILRLAHWSARLAALNDPQTRLAHLVEAARLKPPLPATDRQEVHRVAGCLVRTWWIAQWYDQRCWFQTDSDAMTLKSLAGASPNWPPAELRMKLPRSILAPSTP